MQEKKSKRLATETSLAIVTVAGVMLEVLITLPLVISIVTPSRPFAFFAPLDPTTFYSILTLAALFPPLFPMLVAYFLKPKRIVSSLNIMIGTWAVDTFLYATTVPTSYNLGVAQLGLFLFSYLFGALAVMGGYFEVKFVGWFIGLDFEEVNRQTFEVNVPAKPISDILLSEEYFPRYRKEVKVNEPSRILVIKREAWGTDFIVVGLAKNPNAPHASSIIAFVTFKQGLYNITKSDSANTEREIMKEHLRELLKADYPNVKFDPKENFTDIASSNAFGVAQAPADSKLAVGQAIFRDLPRTFQIVLALTIGGLLLSPTFAIFKIGSFDYASIFAVFLALLLGEVVFAVREEIIRRHGREETWPSS